MSSESSKIEVVKIGLEELPKLQELGKSTFLETFAGTVPEQDMTNYLESSFSIQTLTSELQNKDSEFFFVLVNSEAVAYMKLNYADAQNEFKEKNGLEIQRFYALKKSHGKQIGKRLMDKALERASEKKVDFIWLGVWEYNHKALRFYQKHGFEVFDKHDFIVGDDVSTDLLMKKEFY